MSKKMFFISALIITLLSFAGIPALAASNLEEGVGQLAQQISKSMEEKQKQKIAIIDFTDLNGKVTTLGQFMAEELTTQLFMVAPGKFEVVERRQILKLEEELMLGQTGFIEEKSIKKMGQVLGVDAIVTGSMTDLGNTVKINARLIGVESAKVFAVAATDIPKTGMVADLIGKQVEGRQTAAHNKPTQPDQPDKGKKHKHKVMGRVYDADDVVTMYVNGKEAILVKWGQGENGSSIGHRPGDSGWVDISDYFSRGNNEVRMTVWNDSGCCGVAGTFQVKVDDELIVDRKFNRQDSSQGIKYDEKAQVNLR